MSSCSSWLSINNCLFFHNNAYEKMSPECSASTVNVTCSHYSDTFLKHRIYFTLPLPFKKAEVLHVGISRPIGRGQAWSWATRTVRISSASYLKPTHQPTNQPKMIQFISAARTAQPQTLLGRGLLCAWRANVQQEVVQDSQSEFMPSLCVLLGCGSTSLVSCFLSHGSFAESTCAVGWSS